MERHHAKFLISYTVDVILEGDTREQRDQAVKTEFAALMATVDADGGEYQIQCLDHHPATERCEREEKDRLERKALREGTFEGKVISLNLGGAKPRLVN